MALYAVTGAAGFIGSHLVDTLLRAGHAVRGLDDLSTGRMENLDPRCTLIRGDVADPAAVGQLLAGADGCFHLAAIASVERANKDWLGAHRTNLTGTITILDAARATSMPVVYASSAAVYGNLGDVAAREDLRPQPQTAYGADKLGSELHAYAAWLVHGVPTFGLRFFNVYGPRQDPASPYSGVISIFARRISAGLPVVVHGDGQQLRDFVYVADVAAHLTAAMQRLRQAPGADIANVCTGRGTSLLKLLETLGPIHRRTPAVSHDGDRPGDIRRSLGDPTHAMDVLKIQAETGLAEGLQKLAGQLMAAE